MVVLEQSPFVFSGPAPADQVVGRDDLIAALWNRAAAGKFVLLSAPRRYGKTSLVRRLQRDAHRSGDLVVVIVDLLGIGTPADLAARMAQAWGRLPRGPVERAVSKITRYLPEVSLALGPVTLNPPTRAPRPPDDDRRSVEALLGVPFRVAERLDRRLLVVLDEFQAVAAVPGIDATIRSQIQHQTERVAYLFCGSEQSTLRMLFTDRSAPLYGQAEQIELPPLDAASAGELIATNFARTGREVDDEVLVAVLSMTAGHPQRTMFLAHHLWEETADGGIADYEVLARAGAVALHKLAGEFDAITELMSPPARKVCRLAAWGDPFFGAAAQRLGLPKGSGQRALATLAASGILDGNGNLIDPLYGEWLRRLNPRP